MGQIIHPVMTLLGKLYPTHPHLRLYAYKNQESLPFWKKKCRGVRSPILLYERHFIKGEPTTYSGLAISHTISGIV